MLRYNTCMSLAIVLCMHCSPIVQGIIALLSYDVDNRVDDGAILDI